MGKIIFKLIAILAFSGISFGIAAEPKWQKAAAIPIAVEGAACNSATDKIGVTSGNQLMLYCQSGVWAKQTGGGIGSWRLQTYANDYWLTGIGVYNSSTGLFTGTIMCDPTVYSESCGASGTYWCGSNEGCTWNRAHHSMRFSVGVSALPVTSVTQQW